MVKQDPLQLLSVAFSSGSPVQPTDKPCSFGWSDFPIVGDGATTNLDREVSVSSTDRDWQEPMKREVQDEGSDDTCSTASVESLSEEESLDGSTAVASTQERSENKKKRVSFSHILQVRTYESILGDHPFCSGGMALEMGWRHSGTECLDLDTYEDIHGPSRRRMGELHLNYGQRRARLQDVMRLTGAQLLRLEYELVCLDQEEQELQRQRNGNSQGSSSPSQTSSFRPLHHAKTVSNFIDHQSQPRIQYSFE